jgi:MFS family permease
MLEHALVSRPAAARQVRGWLQAWPYWPALSHPALRRLLPGYALSALGDGMSAVAIAWLALELAPPARQGLWVAAALAAYSLPGALGMVVFGRWLRSRRGVGLAGADATLRAVALGAVGVLAWLHLLTPPTYVALIGISSLLHAWGTAGQFTLIAEILPPDHRVAGNGLLGVTAEITLVGGPALAGVLTAAAGAATVIAADAATFAVLAVSYAWAAPLVPRAPPRPTPPEPAGAEPAGVAEPARVVEQTGVPSAGVEPDLPERAASPQGEPAEAGPGQAGSAWRVLRSSPTVFGLLVLTFVFYVLYGPVEVALPVYVATGLGGSAALLGAFWSAYAVGAIAGTLAAPYLRHWPVWPAMVGIVAGWGLALLPIGLGAPLAVALISFAVGGLIYAPYTSLSVAVVQDTCPPASLAPVLAARTSLLILSAPVGTAFGGPLVGLLGARGTLLASALTTIALAVAVTLVAAVRRGATRGPIHAGLSSRGRPR